jgi:hypothetical protein
LRRPRLERMRVKGGRTFRRLEGASAAELEEGYGLTPFERDRLVATARAELDLIGEWLVYCRRGAG